VHNSDSQNNPNKLRKLIEIQPVYFITVNDILATAASLFKDSQNHQIAGKQPVIFSLAKIKFKKIILFFVN